LSSSLKATGTTGQFVAASASSTSASPSWQNKYIESIRETVAVKEVTFIPTVAKLGELETAISKATWRASGDCRQCSKEQQRYH
jgi:hypothetical protein